MNEAKKIIEKMAKAEGINDGEAKDLTANIERKEKFHNAVKKVANVIVDQVVPVTIGVASGIATGMAIIAKSKYKDATVIDVSEIPFSESTNTD